jgi:hypothetical protein
VQRTAQSCPKDQQNLLQPWDQQNFAKDHLSARATPGGKSKETPHTVAERKRPPEQHFDVLFQVAEQHAYLSDVRCKGGSCTSGACFSCATNERSVRALENARAWPLVRHCKSGEIGQQVSVGTGVVKALDGSNDANRLS